MVREDLSEAVHYLEELTGLRYYPVPTLLVDEHVVKTVRTTQTIDLGPVDPELVFGLLAAVLPERWTRRIWSGWLWVTPLAAMSTCVYLTMPWFRL